MSWRSEKSKKKDGLASMQRYHVVERAPYIRVCKAIVFKILENEH
jgi:hypothetical protein